MTNTGPTIVTGNLGVSPGSAVTGFPPGVVTPPGTIHTADAVALQAQNDATSAYNALAAEPCTADLTGQDLAGLTLTTGVYCFTSSAFLTGTLTLDAEGNAAAVFIFKIGSTLITSSGSAVNVINGGIDCNAWWQVGSSATLGTTTSFRGNILALASIGLTTGATLSGRAFALTGAVTMDSNLVGASACIPPPNPGLSLTKDDGGVTVAPGDTILYTLTFQNTGNTTLTDVTLTDTIPAGTTFNPGASTPGWDCSASPCTFDVGTLMPGQGGSVIFAVTVDNPTGATLIENTAVITSGGTTATDDDDTPVTQVPPGPAISLSKDDGGVTVEPGDIIVYTLTFQNTGNVDLTNVILTDTVPAGTTFNPGASTPGWNCGVSPCTLNLGTLTPGQTGSALFAVTVNDPSGTDLIVNSATISSGGTSDSDDDDTPVTLPPPPNPELTISKDDGGVTVEAGDTIRYTLTFQNTGNIPLPNVTLIETVPAGTTFNPGASTPGWNCPASPCTFDLGTLAPGTSGSAIFAVTVDDPISASEITNTVIISSGEITDSDEDDTPIQPPDDDDEDDEDETDVPDVPTVSAPGVTPAAPGITPAAPGITPLAPGITPGAPLILMTATPGAPGTGGGGSTSGGGVIGLPNTGGGPPQATYWLVEEDEEEE